MIFLKFPLSKVSIIINKSPQIPCSVLICSVYFVKSLSCLFATPLFSLMRALRLKFCLFDFSILLGYLFLFPMFYFNFKFASVLELVVFGIPLIYTTIGCHFLYSDTKEKYRLRYLFIFYLFVFIYLFLFMIDKGACYKQQMIIFFISGIENTSWIGISFKAIRAFFLLDQFVFLVKLSASKDTAP